MNQKVTNTAEPPATNGALPEGKLLTNRKLPLSNAFVTTKPRLESAVALVTQKGGVWLWLHQGMADASPRCPVLQKLIPIINAELLQISSDPAAQTKSWSMSKSPPRHSIQTVTFLEDDPRTSG